MFGMLIDILTSPFKAFEKLKTNPTWVFPLLLIVTLSAATTFFVMNMIDFEFFVEAMIDQALQRPNPPPESEIRQGMEVLQPWMISIGGVAGALLILPIIYAIYGFYLSWFDKGEDEELNFKHFFSVVCWSGIPNLITVIATIGMVLISSDKQFGPDDLNPLSLQSLFFRGVEGFPSGLANLTLVSFWTLGLLVVGYKVMTGCTWLKSALIVLIPPLLIWGGLGILTA